jgi:hypothetical protein
MSNAPNKSGSTILMVLMLMSLLMVISLATLKSSQLAQQFALERMRVMQQDTLAQSLLNYGISLVKQHYEDWSAVAGAHDIMASLAQYEGKLTFLGDLDSGITITAILEKQDKPLCILSCKVVKNSEQKLLIEGFQRGSFPL